MDAVYVEWLDINTMPEPWTDIEEAKELAPASVCGLGWLVYENDHHIVICGHRGNAIEDKGLGGVWAIPKGAIQQLKRFDHENI